MATDQAKRRAHRFIIDHSVWARLATTPAVVSALSAIATMARPRDVLICPPVALEFGFSARSGVDHRQLRDRLDAFGQCETHPSVERVLSIQAALWNGGLARAAGSLDTLIAGYALENDATLVHYDRDFEHIAAVVPEFRQQWIVPRGSVA